MSTHTLKARIKGLVEEKVTLTSMRKRRKSRARPEHRQTDDYHRFFCELDARRAMVRHHIRHALLAYGFMRGLAYRSIEQRALSRPQAKQIHKELMDHGRWVKIEDIEAWLGKEEQDASKEAA